MMMKRHILPKKLPMSDTFSLLQSDSRLLSTGIVLLLSLLCAVWLLPLLLPHDPSAFNPGLTLQQPSVSHLFGTDRFGRDIFIRVLYGGRITLSAGGIALVTVVTIGLFIGISAGYLGGIFGSIAMRVVDTLLAFPSIVVGLVVAGLFGPGLTNVLLAVISVWWVSFARLAYSITLKTKHEPYVLAAVAIGARPITIMLKEILPKTAGPIIVLATLELGSLIIWISGLSFLGLGAQPPSPEWGAMLADARAYFLVFPHLMIFPGLMIFLSVLSLVMIGEGLRDIIDPDQVAVKKGKL